MNWPAGTIVKRRSYYYERHKMKSKWKYAVVNENGRLNYLYDDIIRYNQIPTEISHWRKVNHPNIIKRVELNYIKLRLLE